jgi:hypothetical protein
MLYCNHCKKEVVILESSSSAGMDEEIDQWRGRMLKQGKLVLYNPPLIGKYYCPKCEHQLEEKD